LPISFLFIYQKRQSGFINIGSNSLLIIKSESHKQAKSICFILDIISLINFKITIMNFNLIIQEKYNLYNKCVLKLIIIKRDQILLFMFSSQLIIHLFSF
jgi:hypothetical protein